MICRGTDISKCFRESLAIRDNESRLYILYIGVLTINIGVLTIYIGVLTIYIGVLTIYIGVLTRLHST